MVFTAQKNRAIIYCHTTLHTLIYGVFSSYVRVQSFSKPSLYEIGTKHEAHCSVLALLSYFQPAMDNRLFRSVTCNLQKHQPTQAIKEEHKIVWIVITYNLLTILTIMKNWTAPLVP